MRIIAFLVCMVGISVWAQVDSTKNERLNNLNLEIANLTRTPLGEGDVVLDRWVEFSVEQRGNKTTGRIHFAKEDSSVVWYDDISRNRSFFYRKTPNSPINTVVLSINQGTELTEEMMTAMGYYNDHDPTIYTMHKDAPVSEILERECEGAGTEITEENTDVTTVWVCSKGDLKKGERKLIRRAVEVWCSNQTNRTRIQSAQLDESWNVLGFSEEDFDFRIVDWGFDDDFAFALDKIMVNTPGRDIKQVAKEYYEKHKESQKED